MFDRKSCNGDISNTKPAIRFHADFRLYKPLFETGSQLSESHWFTNSPVRRVKDKNHEQALTTSLSQPVQFLGGDTWMCLQTVYFLVLFSHLHSMLRVLMKILSHASAKKKTKAKNKNFKFRILIGHFQGTSWQ